MGYPLTRTPPSSTSGKVHLEVDSDWTGVVHNFRRVRQKRSWMSIVLSREVVDARTLRRVYVAVVQNVVIYGFEMWVMTPNIGRVLGRFHHRVAHKFTGRQPWRVRDSGWLYLPLVDAMSEAR